MNTSPVWGLGPSKWRAPRLSAISLAVAGLAGCLSPDTANSPTSAQAQAALSASDKQQAGKPCDDNADCPGGYECKPAYLPAYGSSANDGSSDDGAGKSGKGGDKEGAGNSRKGGEKEGEGKGGNGGGEQDGEGKGDDTKTCQPKNPKCVATAETCNGQDDDCDGATDEGSPCSDGLFCNGDEACVAGKCQLGKAPSCDDGQPCTADTCVQGQGCVHAKAPAGTTCDDGDACTGCALPAGVVKRYKLTEAKNCPEEKWAGCNAMWMPGFYDGNKAHIVRLKFMPGADLTVFIDGTARVSAVAYAYDLGGGSGDLNAKWDVALKLQYRGQGAVGEGSGGPKLDGGWFVPKTVTDSWQYFDVVAGAMQQVGGAATVELSEHPKGSVFPLQLGIGANGKTMAFSSSAWLDWVKHDGAATWSGNGDFNVDVEELPLPPGCDVCSDGQCQSGAAMGCDDGNPCTSDACEGKACQHKPFDGAACDDGLACTGGEKCQGGACKPAKTDDSACDDGNPCTADSCLPQTGCSHAANTAPCNDGDACTQGDTCAAGACSAGKVMVCTDGQPCTVDACDFKTGCVFPPLQAGSPCDDGNACTSGDACIAGACQGQTPTLCDDQNPCTADSCAPLGGCAHQNSDGIGCDDGDACSIGDACAAGSCKGSKAKDCDDGKACTADGCDAKIGCTHQDVPAGGPCDDGNACTGKDTCAGGLCQGGAPPKCTDGNLCTNDVCDPASGCTYPPADGAKCNDGSVCTLDDTCQGGKCGGKATNCNDGKACTADTCDPLAGCQHAPGSGMACDDGDPCTGGDLCQDGACVPGKKQGCDDGNPCTADSCTGNGACAHVANGLADGGLQMVSDTKTLANGKPAVATWNGHPDWTAKVAGATWIWSTVLVDNPEISEVVIFTRSFEVPLGAQGISGNLLVAADNSYYCYVNEAKIGDDQTEKNYIDAGKDTWPVGGAVKPGTNLFKCAVKNWAQPGGTQQSNPAGLLYRLELTWKAPIACEDGSACTLGDACAAGACKPGKAVDCSDGNQCTGDVCDPATGKCASSPTTGGQCDDGNACTGACAQPGLYHQWQAQAAPQGAGGEGHAITLPGFYDNNMAHAVRFHLDADARFDWLSDGVNAHLYGTATVYDTGGAAGGAVGDKWAVDCWFTYRGKGEAGQGTGGPKKELGGFQTKAVTDTWLYFDMVPGKATLKRVGNPNDYATLTQQPASSMYPFQVGVGANGKNIHFGACSWVAYTHYLNGANWGCGGDFNLDLPSVDPAGNCDKCDNGACKGAPIDCNDLNPFTNDSCDPAKGCVHAAVQGG